MGASSMTTVIKERRTQADRSAAARAALVDAAITLLSERGYAHATTAAIAKAAGVTTGALHHHFPTKEALFMAVLDQLSEDALGLFAALSESGPAGESPATVLLDTLWSLYGSKRYWAVWEINMGFRPDEKMHVALIEHRARTRQQMYDEIARNEALGADTKRALSVLLPFVLSSMRGMFLDTFFAGHEPGELDEQLAVLRQVFERELAVVVGKTAPAKPAAVRTARKRTA
jgi:AcrR family transcriptional regulator